MSELNRPETPGPWESRDEEETLFGVWHGEPGRAGSLPVAAFIREQDARAIADLPAWIAAHDDLAQEVSDLRLRVAQLLNEKDDESLRLREIERFGGAA